MICVYTDFDSILIIIFLMHLNKDRNLYIFGYLLNGILVIRNTH